MSLCLTKEELAGLTGHTRRKKQAEVLARLGIPFLTNTKGDVKVIRSHLQKTEPQAEPEWPFDTPIELDGPAVILNDNCVYFLQFVDDGKRGLIKIGFSRQFHARRHQIAREFRVRSTYFEALGSAPGSLEYEAQIHERFDYARVYREWFEPVPELLEFIASVHEERPS